MKFKDKVVLVTGGSRGIGAAVCRSFAKEGAKLAINYCRDSLSASDFHKSLPGGPHILLKADVTSESNCQKLIDSVISQFGQLDILVNNAGIHEKHPINEVDYAGWNRIFRETLEVNLLAPARLMFLAAHVMMSQGEGKIVNISSRGAFRGEPDQPAYGASKAGLNALSQSLAQKLAPMGIHVGVVAPGFVETDMAAEILSGPQGDAIRAQSPFGRVAMPEEVAHAVLFLASEEARFSTGTIIDVNGASYLRS